MERKRIGMAAAGVGVLGLLVNFVVQRVPEVLFEMLVEGPTPSWLRYLEVGTVGQTLTFYNVVLGILGPVLLLGLGLTFGYLVQNRVDVSREFHRLATTVLVGSGLGVVLTVVVLGGIGAVASPSAVDASSVFFYLLALVRFIAEVALPITVATLAGVTLAHFSADGDARPQPTDADSTPSDTMNTNSH